MWDYQIESRSVLWGFLSLFRTNFCLIPRWLAAMSYCFLTALLLTFFYLLLYFSHNILRNIWDWLPSHFLFFFSYCGSSLPGPWLTGYLKQYNHFSLKKAHTGGCPIEHLLLRLLNTHWFQCPYSTGPSTVPWLSVGDYILGHWKIPAYYGMAPWSPRVY